MKLVLTFAVAVSLVIAQNVNYNTKKVSDISLSQRAIFLKGYVEVTTKPPGSIGAAVPCGKGTDKGINLCVPYYQCDGITNLIVQTGVANRIGLIDISSRIGEKECDHHLDVCCKIPPGGLNPNLPQPGEIITTTTTTTQRSAGPGPTISPVRKDYCGIRNSQGIDFKLTGNHDNEAEYGEFPWVVAILKTVYDQSEDSNLAGGGSLITPSVVLTGAHIVSKFRASDIKVRAGEWDTQTTKERLPYQERNVVNIITHKDFNGESLFNDVALLVLDRSVDQAENVGTICLPSQGQRIQSENCFVTGWGKDVFSKQGKYQVILKKIQLPLIQTTKCEAALRKTRLSVYFELHQSFICAGGEEGKDACSGDGGGPLICPDPQNPRRYVQVGIVAWGVSCGEANVPGVYADVTKFRSWINQQMQILNIDTTPYNV